MSGLGETPRLAALVPMRHHSERVPGKNYRPLAGRPLYEYILETLQAVPEVAEIVVDTDSPVIQAGVRRAFPGVRLLDRPPHLRDDRVPMNEVLLHDVQQVEAPFYLQTHSTNPLLTSGTLQEAINRFLETFPEHDSLFTVTTYHARFWDAGGRPLNHDPARLDRTQDLPPLYLENSCAYLFERSGFLERGNRLGANPLLHPIDPLEAWDIDDPLDFTVAELLMAQRARFDGAPGGS